VTSLFEARASSQVVVAGYLCFIASPNVRITANWFLILFRSN